MTSDYRLFLCDREDIVRSYFTTNNIYKNDDKRLVVFLSSILLPALHT